MYPAVFTTSVCVDESFPGVCGAASGNVDLSRILVIRFLSSCQYLES